MPFQGVTPVEQSFIGGHQRRSMDQRGRDNESIGRIIVQAGKLERAHCHRPVERQLDCAGRKHRLPPLPQRRRQPDAAASNNDRIWFA